MDWLKLEIDSKKRALSASATTDDGQPAPKYIKRADLERQRQKERDDQAAREAQERQERLLAAAKKVARKEDETSNTLRPPSSTTSKGKEGTPASGAEDEAGAGGGDKVDQVKPEAFNVSNEEAILRLRRKGQPIRLFGESDKDRRLRLRALELIEERSEGQRNDFMRAMDGVEVGFNLEEVAKKGSKDASAATSGDAKGKGKEVAAVESKEGTPATAQSGGEDSVREPNPKDEEVIVDVSLAKSNPHKIYPQIYHALKRVLKEWEQSLLDRPEAVRRSTQGRMASATQQTSAEYLKPLFKSLRKRDLAPDVLQAIAEITFCMQTREYLRANDAYLRLSIGNAPWPIGVTMVGIHERSGREKIFSNNVAHVLNDETSRKYIQSLKRLLTFAQTVRPPADLSQLMG
ncbi:Prp18 domain-domain-containing protein [Leucosporidium creatinivorum]|uniref:Pre-mRNA-splicing factor 18 n=1 Tax=Leucosporidium creatinivorum TaxID=106004 RepID=A0A1Y2CCV1_9BASI|nr:Prp18 domain-domain-containing protein [Leucosporidium creatinivorum]